MGINRFLTTILRAVATKPLKETHDLAAYFPQNMKHSAIEGVKDNFMAFWYINKKLGRTQF